MPGPSHRRGVTATPPTKGRPSIEPTRKSFLSSLKVLNAKYECLASTRHGHERMARVVCHPSPSVATSLVGPPFTGADVWPCLVWFEAARTNTGKDEKEGGSPGSCPFKSNDSYCTT